MFMRAILAQWLRNAAQQKLREAAMEAAQRELGGDAEDGDAPPPDCQVGIVFALGVESGGMEDRLEGLATTRGYGFVAKRGMLGERGVVLIRSGPAAEAAARAAEALLVGHNPRWVISAGFAGGLRPELALHDLLMVDSVVDLQGRPLALDMKVDRTSLAQAKHVHVGRLLTADRIIRLPEEKRTLGEKHEALAVDMETYAVAEVCRRRHVPFLAVRIISDTADETLPPDIDRLMQATQSSSVARTAGTVVGTLWNRPGSVKDLYALKERALQASDRLAKFLAGMIGQLG